MPHPARREGESAPSRLAASVRLAGEDGGGIRRPIPGRGNLAGRFRNLAEAAGAAVAAVGVLVLMGWAAGCEPLKSVLPGLNAMNPMSALCFVLCGAALGVQMRAAESS